MFLFNIELIPKPGSAQAEKFGGAYALCLIDFALKDGAEVLARYYLEQDDWQPLQTESARMVTREEYEKDHSQSLEYYDEAASDGACFVYHSWPLGMKDEEEADELSEPGFTGLKD